MANRKQKRRDAKSKRHEYEFVYLDSEGHELEEPPEELAAAARPKARAAATNGGAAKKQPPPARRGRREPQPPSWRRSLKRSVPWTLALGAFLIYVNSREKNGNLASAILFAAVYVFFFPPFIYMIDRFTYNRYIARRDRDSSAKAQTAKKR